MRKFDYLCTMKNIQDFFCSMWATLKPILGRIKKIPIVHRSLLVLRVIFKLIVLLLLIVFSLSYGFVGIITGFIDLIMIPFMALSWFFFGKCRFFYLSECLSTLWYKMDIWYRFF
jgi:hypothetical protein